MATNVDLRGLSARTDPRNVSNTMRHNLTFSDVGLANGVAIGPDALPQNAFIIGCWVEIVQAFNAGTTNTLTVGTNSPAYNNIVAVGDIAGNGTATIAASVTAVARPLGRSLTAAGDVPVFIKFVQTGTPANTGQAIVVIEFEGGWTT